MYELRTFTPIAKTNWRDHNQLFGIKPNDRLFHLLCLGKTGTGKSKLIVNMALDDIYKRQGVCVLDPLGETIDEILRGIPSERAGSVVHFDATNAKALPAFNPIYNVPPDQQQLVASEIVTVFKKLFLDAWGSKMEYILRFCIVSLLQYPDGTLLDISRLLTDRNFRASVLAHVKNPQIISFWVSEYDTYTQSVQTTSILPILNKIGVLLANDTLRGIFGQRNNIDIEAWMNDGKVILCNLSKGIIGEDIAIVLGSFLVTTIQNVALRRASVPQDMRKPFHLFIDESQNFVSNALAGMLPQVRKYGLSLFLASQQLDSLEAETKNAILANVATFVIFRVGMNDAKLMEKEFYPRFTYEDFLSLPKYHVYVKLMIDGTESKGFSAVTVENFG